MACGEIRCGQTSTDDDHTRYILTDRRYHTATRHYNTTIVDDHGLHFFPVISCTACRIDANINTIVVTAKATSMTTMMAMAMGASSSNSSVDSRPKTNVVDRLPFPSLPSRRRKVMTGPSRSTKSERRRSFKRMQRCFENIRRL